MKGSGMRRALAIALAAGLAFAARGAAASPEPSPPQSGPPERRKVVAGEQYRRGWLHRFLFGNDYRDLWTTPVELPVLDLRAFAGGLTPVRRLGSGQSENLALTGADGRSYTFRNLIKDPSGVLPVELQETFASRLLKDQMASEHPAGHVIVPGLLDAVGVLHNVPTLVVMPDDPLLGEFRADFADLAGDIEEFGGSPGFAGAEESLGGQEMWKRLQVSPDVRADSRAYLAARLVDHLIGDWDRHRNQWRWAKLPGQTLWQPIPEDRDQAFVKFEGVMISLVRPSLPLLLDFGPKYPSLHGLTFNGWGLDRRLLADLGKPAWDEVAAWVKSRITDEVIEEAVRRMPPEYFEKKGPQLIAALKGRRDRLLEQADRFYRFLSRQVDIYCTDVGEVVEVVRLENGGVEVFVARAAEAGVEPPPPYFRRRFDPKETKEVRIRLFGGDDRVVVRGRRRGILLRVAGGDGDDTLDDSAGGGTRFSDWSGRDRVLAGPETSWDRRRYTPPPNGDAWPPPREWGRRTISMLRVGGGSDLGAFVSGAVSTVGHGFRRHPFADRQRLRVGYATTAKTFRAQYDGEFRFENSSLRAKLHARASGIEILRFYGFGNETSAPGPDERFKVEQDQFVLEPSIGWPLTSSLEFSFGPVVKYATTDIRQNPVLAATRPYGVEDLGQVGLAARLHLDTTDRPGLPSRGVLLSAGGTFYPALWDVRREFGEAHGEGALFLGAKLPLDPTLVLKAGGKRVWGRYPFHESAFLGGGSALGAGAIGGGDAAVRGLPPQRYAGDGSLYGSAELRIGLTRVFVFVPAELGLFALADAGRVYLRGESSDRWHTGVGGGIWFASPARRNAISIALAKSEGRTGLYVRAGFGF